jgi:hypothetical protein
MKKMLRPWFNRAVDVKPDDLRALSLVFVFNFIGLGSYS